MIFYNPCFSLHNLEFLKRKLTDIALHCPFIVAKIGTRSVDLTVCYFREQHGWSKTQMFWTWLNNSKYVVFVFHFLEILTNNWSCEKSLGISIAKRLSYKVSVINEKWQPVTPIIYKRRRIFHLSANLNYGLQTLTVMKVISRFCNIQVDQFRPHYRHK